MLTSDLAWDLLTVVEVAVVTLCFQHMDQHAP